MRDVLLSTLALALLCGLPAAAAEPDDIVDIPLKEIWAADMPGTRNIRELEPRTAGDRRKFGPLMSALHRQLTRDNEDWGRPDAGPAFVVPGKDIEALNGAYDVIFANHWEGPHQVPTGEVSLVFYARWTGQYVYVEKVERNGPAITLQYRFVVHRTKEITAHFALIPLGHLKGGKYDVRIIQLPVRHPDNEQGPVFRPPLEEKIANRVVSKSFSFEVE
jgi:hypothetical protein